MNKLLSPGDHELRAMATLNNDADYQIIVDWFTRCLASLDKQNRVSADSALIQGQGAAQLIDEFLGYSDKSKEFLKKKSDNLTRHSR